MKGEVGSASCGRSSEQNEAQRSNATPRYKWACVWAPQEGKNHRFKSRIKKKTPYKSRVLWCGWRVRLGARPVDGAASKTKRSGRQAATLQVSGEPITARGELVRFPSKTNWKTKAPTIMTRCRNEGFENKAAESYDVFVTLFFLGIFQKNLTFT